MRFQVACLLFSSIALAQVTRRDPFDIASQAYWQAHSAGRLADAVAEREQMRTLFDGTAVDIPQFAERARALAQMYESAGFGLKARSLLKDALSRADRLGESHASRIALLNALSDFAMQDRNLLKAVFYKEKAIAALEAAPPALPTAQPASGQQVVAFTELRSGAYSARFDASRGGPGLSSQYLQLAEFYQQLGRPEAAAAVIKKSHKAAKDNPAELASIYERQGQLEEAAAMYRQQVEQAAANPKSQPWEVTMGLQQLASLYQREQRYDDAVTTLQQAVATLNASGKPEAANQALGLRQNIARILNQAGRTADADKAYQQLLSETPAQPGMRNFGVATDYAYFLAATKRAPQAEEYLKNYLATQSNMQPWEESNLLYSLSNVARQSGDTKRAEEYQLAAQAKQQQHARPQEPAGVSINKDLQKAQAAANAGNVDEAFALAMQAMDAAPRAADRDSAAWMVGSIASSLAARKAPDKAEQLYQTVFALVESWSAETVQPLLAVLQNRAQFLMQQPSRIREVPDAIERYRSALADARGSDSGQLNQAANLSINFERSHGSMAKAIRAGEDLLALEESLAGTTSVPYLQAAENLAGVCESGGESVRSLALRKQAVAIADLAYRPNDAARAFTRINTAFALARLGQFEEAERLASEAEAIGKQVRPPQGDHFSSQIAVIRRMKAAGAQGAAPGGTGDFLLGNRGAFGVVNRVSPWFDGARFDGNANPATVPVPATGTITSTLTAAPVPPPPPPPPPPAKPIPL